MPRAADAFLLGGLPLSHNPLVRINSNPPAVPFDLDAFEQMWEDFLTTYLFDIIESVTGIDLSSVAGLINSFSDLFFNNFIGLIPGVLGGLTGAAGLGSIFGDLFGLLGSPTGLGSGTPGLPGIGSIPILGGLFGGDGKILTTLLSVPVSVITGLTGAVQEVQQELIDLIVNALAGTPGHIGNPIEMVFTGINGLTTAVGAIDEVTDSLSAYFQDMGSLLVQIVQQATVRPVLGVIDQVMDAVSFWVFGWFHRTETAHTAQNAGIATLRGEVNAKFASVGTGTDGWVDNFDAPGYSLTTNYSINNGEVTSVLGTRGTNPSIVLKPPASNRASMYYNTEMTTGQVDLEMAISNLTQKGRAALWIGGNSATLGGGLRSGTMLVRIDNGFTNSSEQRLQIYTVGATGAQSTHGNLYTADFGTWHDGDLIRLRKDETTRVHRVYLNDIEVCTFDDSVAHTIDLGAGWRFGGWRQNIDSSSGPNVGPDLDLIHLYDWTT